MTSIIASLLIVLQVLQPSHTPATVQNKGLDAKLQARIEEYHLDAQSFVDALARLASDFRIPMGIQWIEKPAAAAKIIRSWKNASLREIIEEIAKTQHGYRVQVENGVVHVWPLEVIAHRQNFLNLEVEQFEVKDVPLELALRKLRHLIKLKVTAPSRPSARTTSGRAGSLAVNPDDPKISVQVRDGTVEDVLDALAVASARKIWIVTFQQNSALTPTGLRRTRTLWNDLPIPDDEQPLWDMFRWGDSVPRP